MTGSAVVLEDVDPEYKWAQVSGPPVSLEGSDTANPQFKAEDPGVYMFELVVGDGTELSVPDVVVVSVVEPEENTAANWGVDETACGCSGSPLGDASWLLFALPLLLRRRRLGVL